MPLSAPTRAGLKACHFSKLTDIQAKAIPLALKGADILGAAKTGSGKTLAFVIPVLENLYRTQCIGGDAGLGAMIISPTRELAIQIFDVLYKVGRHGHLFAAGLVIGGKSLQEEKDALVRMNIVVCTPGRILQHLSQTTAFNVDNLQMLVLDEADRIMDMGFQRDVDAIIDYLPKDRQTLLFSATQTKRVSDLARLSLRDPEYVSVHEGAASATPQTLQQNYVLTPLPEKLDTLWSFIQSSKKSKMLVFLSSGKQVRFVYEAFRRMQPGVPLLHLHGRQKQTARLGVTSKFSAAKYSCLFATDVVARGLDFPAVDWVVQVDCPEDADTYIHRVGRTARFERDGRAVLFLDPSEEEGMLKRLEAKKVPISRINVRSKKQQSIKNQLQHLCFKEPELKYLGQKAYVSYVKSIHLQKDKEIFKLRELSVAEFSESLGLPGAPTVRFLKGENVKALKNAPHHGLSSSEDEDVDEHSANGKKSKKKGETVRTKWDRMKERVNQDVLSAHQRKLIRDDSENEDEGIRAHNGRVIDENDFLTVKRRIKVDEVANVNSSHDLDLNSERPKKLVHIAGASQPLVVDSKRREKLLTSKKKLLKLKDKGTRLVYDDDGNAHPVYEMEDEAQFRSKGAPESQRARFLEEEKARVQEADVADKLVAKAKKRGKKEKKRERERREAEADGHQSVQGAVLGDGRMELADQENSSVDYAGSQPRGGVGSGPPNKIIDSAVDNQADHSPRRQEIRTMTSGRQDERVTTLEDLEALASGLLQ